MITRRILFSVGVTLLAILVVALLYRPLASVEDQVTALKLAIRGQQRADTNVVIVYIDNEAIKTLGWPVRRNFYALMVKALTDLKAKTIGIDVLFEDPSLEYPEYDDLLAGVISSSRQVVLQSYFDGVVLASAQGSPAGSKGRGVGKFAFPHIIDIPQRGVGLHSPLPRLSDGAAGIGHANVLSDTDVPVFIATGDSVVPSFAEELLRMYAGAERSGVRYSSGIVTIRGEAKDFQFAVSSDGVVRLNFPGKISSFTAYPFVEVLKSYDAYSLRSGGRVGGERISVPVERFNGKVVLVGVIAEGRSEFRDSPVDPRFPSIGLHAVFLDNAMRSGFLESSSVLLVGVVCALVGVVCSVVILFLPRRLGPLIAFGTLILMVVVSVGLFLGSTYVFPLSPLLFVGLVSTIGSLFFQHRMVEGQVDTLRSEKEAILIQLRDKEAKVAILERELLDVATATSKDRTNELLEEIRRYKADIRSLSSRADDMEEYRGAEAEGKSTTGEFEGIIYCTSGKMKSVVEFVGKIASSDAPVLILGTSGTGKELIARAIHKRSQRSAHPFIAVNCGALSESLLESELFGHERGAFTGAVKDRLGRFELADGGTIFLDEIGEVSEAFQVKLLRVLQEGELERVGGTKTIRVNVRVLAATNKELKEAVEAKSFRRDLYYRLNVLSLELPSLRERQEDIPLLVDHFLRREGGEMRVSKNVIDALQRYEWPGNIRELESVVKRAVLLARAERRTMITMKDLAEEVAAAAQGALAVEDQVMQSLREKGFSRSSISETAEELGGLNRGTVAEYLRGQCLQAFIENEFDLEQTVHAVSLSSDGQVNARVRKKIQEYLANIIEAIDRSQPWDSTKGALQPKTKNLPQRYHRSLERVAEAYYRGRWKLTV